MALERESSILSPHPKYKLSVLGNGYSKLVWSQEHAGSSPVTETINRRVAQLVEQRTLTP